MSRTGSPVPRDKALKDDPVPMSQDSSRSDAQADAVQAAAAIVSVQSQKVLEKVNYFEWLPDEIVLGILEKLEIEDLLRMAPVSKRMRHLVEVARNNGQVWAPRVRFLVNLIGKVDTFDFLMKKLLDSKGKASTFFWYGVYLLFRSFRSGDVLEAVSNEGASLLISWLGSRNAQQRKDLLAVRSFFTDTLSAALSTFVDQREVDMCRAILSSGFAELEVQETIGDRLTLLHRTAQAGYPKIAKFLLVHGADPNAVDLYNNTPLHKAICAIQSGCPGTVKLLLSKGASPDVADFYGTSLLHIAATSDLPGVVKSLLLGGANPNAQDRVGDTPLHLAARVGNNINVIKQLVLHGADLNIKCSRGQYPLELTGSLDQNTMYRIVVKTLLAKPGIDLKQTSVSGAPLIVLAAFVGNEEAVKACLDAGAEANWKNDEGSILHMVLGSVKSECITVEAAYSILNLLLDHGADRDAIDSESRPPVLYAVEFGGDDLVRFFIDRGANLLVKNKFGHSLQRCVELCCSKETQEHLQKALVKQGQVAGSEGLEESEAQAGLQDSFRHRLGRREGGAGTGRGGRQPSAQAQIAQGVFAGFSAQGINPDTAETMSLQMTGYLSSHRS